jgi:hypothetical protein
MNGVDGIPFETASEERRRALAALNLTATPETNAGRGRTRLFNERAATWPVDSDALEALAAEAVGKDPKESK